MLRAGVVGLGQMGSGAAVCLARSGRPLAVYDINPDAALKWKDGDLLPPFAENCAEVARTSDVVILFVVNAEQVWAVLNGPEGILGAAQPGLVVVIGSTLSLADLAELRTAAHAAGVILVDCGVTVSPGGHANKGIIGMIGAAPDTFEYIRDVLEDFMQEVFLMGGPGAGMSTKIIRNLLYYATWHAACQSAALAEAAGIDIGKLAAIHALSENGGSPAAIWLRARIDRNSIADGGEIRQAHLRELMLKDLAAAKQLSGDFGLEPPLIDLVSAAAAEITSPWR